MQLVIANVLDAELIRRPAVKGAEPRDGGDVTRLDARPGGTTLRASAIFIKRVFRNPKGRAGVLSVSVTPSGILISGKSYRALR